MKVKKAKSKREKGNDFQRWIRDWLQKNDWVVRNFPTEMRPLKVKDESKKKNLNKQNLSEWLDRFYSYFKSILQPHLEQRKEAEQAHQEIQDLIKSQKETGLKDIYVPRKNDVFGADLICRKSDNTMYIAASLDPHITRRVEEFIKYFEKINPYERIQIWIKTDKGINIKSCILEEGSLIAKDFGKIIRGKFYVSREI